MVSPTFVSVENHLLFICEQMYYCTQNPSFQRIICYNICSVKNSYVVHEYHFYLSD